MLTASGDSTCILWDIATKSPKKMFSDHTGDVMSVTSLNDNGTFISGSCDATAKLWDIRAKKAVVHTFEGHESDINTVEWFPNKNAFGTGADDSQMRLYDLRALCTIVKYEDPKILTGITSVAFTKSGHNIIGGYDDHRAYVFDTITGENVNIMQHDNRVSCLQMSADGNMLCTGSWDTQVRLWA
jgi:guanine nucleotide-binding protein G(I)/G(S)/G(T) subunit beta-1